MAGPLSRALFVVRGNGRVSSAWRGGGHGGLSEVTLRPDFTIGEDCASQQVDCDLNV